jgi:hypothetical protein
MQGCSEVPFASAIGYTGPAPNGALISHSLAPPERGAFFSSPSGRASHICAIICATSDRLYYVWPFSLGPLWRRWPRFPGWGHFLLAGPRGPVTLVSSATGYAAPASVRGNAKGLGPPIAGHFLWPRPSSHPRAQGRAHAADGVGGNRSIPRGRKALHGELARENSLVARRSGKMGQFSEVSKGLIQNDIS